jgi:hypothetical protein
VDDPKDVIEAAIRSALEGMLAIDHPDRGSQFDIKCGQLSERDQKHGSKERVGSTYPPKARRFGDDYRKYMGKPIGWCPEFTRWADLPERLHSPGPGN